MKSYVLNKNMTPSEENYLKVLLELSAGEEEVRSSDVAETLQVTKASVSCMMRRLRDEGYITMEIYGLSLLRKKDIKKPRM